MDGATLWCIVVPVLIIVGYLMFRNSIISTRNKAIDAARGIYEEALRKLKERPADPNRREAALAAGRNYASVARQNGQPTIFDEMALKNDLDAATAGAAVLAAAPPAPVAGPSVADRLRQLDELKAQGLVSEAEYAERRAKILEGV